MNTRKLRRLLWPDRYVVAIFAFFVLFPVFMDAITPDVISGYAGGTVDPQGNVVERYEGGNAPQYQWYYPVLWPFIAFWYVAVLLFGLVDGLVPMTGLAYDAVLAAYFYLLALVLGALLRRAPHVGRGIISRAAADT